MKVRLMLKLKAKRRRLLKVIATKVQWKVSKKEQQMASWREQLMVVAESISVGLLDSAVNAVMEGVVDGVIEGVLEGAWHHH